MKLRNIILVALFVLIVAVIGALVYFDKPEPPTPGQTAPTATTTPIWGIWLSTNSHAVTTLLIQNNGRDNAQAQLRVQDCQGITLTNLVGTLASDSFILSSPALEIIGSWSGDTLIVSLPHSLQGQFKRIASTQDAQKAISAFKASCPKALQADRRAVA